MQWAPAAVTDLAAIPWPTADRRAPAAAAEARAWARPAFWIGVFTVLVFSGGWAMLVIGPNGNPQAGTLVIALHTPAYAAAVWLLARGGGTAVRALVSSPLVWLLFALCAASTLWSINPGQTERRAAALFFTTLAGFALAARFEWRELSEVLALSYAVLIVASVLMAVLVPSWGRMTELFPGAWRGVWSDKNALGGHMAKGFGLLMAAAALNPKRRWLWTGFALASLALIQLSWSKTALVTALVGGGVLGFVALVRRGGAVSVAASFAAVTGLAALGFTVAFAREAVLGLLGKDATLTGRTAIWAAAMLEIEKRPLLGYGYQAVWSTDERWAPLAWIVKHARFKAEHAHNAWVETRLGLGFLGLAAWSAVFAEFWLRAAASAYRSRGAWLVLPFLAVYSLQTLTESAAYIYNDFTWVIFVALLARLALPRTEDDGAVDGPGEAEGAAP